MNWRTGVRVGVALVGLGVATAVFIKSRTGPPPPPLPADPPKLDPNVSLIGGAGKIIQYKGDKPSLEVTATRQTNYTDGRIRFDGAVVTGLGEHAFKIRGAVIETKSAPTTGQNPIKFEVSGGFTFEGSDGMVVESDQGAYDDETGVMTMPGAVKYRRGRLSGTSQGATYEREKDSVTLLDAATADVAADATGKGAAQATSRRMVMARGQHTLQMFEGARIVGEEQVLSAQNATVVFTEDESAMRFLDLVGTARVAPGPKAAAGQPSLSADKITMSFQPDGITMQHSTLTGRAVLTTGGASGARSIRASWIDLFTGTDGRTLIALKARDGVAVEIPATDKTPARSITAATLTATGEEQKGLTSARFEGAPCFQEDTAVGGVRGRSSAPVDPNACSAASRAAARKASAGSGGASTRRVGTATVIVLKLGGEFDAIEEAEFQQNASFDSGRAAATGHTAVYDEKAGLLRLRPDARQPGRQPGVDTGDLNVSANEIDLEVGTENLKARGAVSTRTQRKAAKGQTTEGSLFDGEGPVYGNADALEYTRESGRALYTGTKAPARLKQGSTDISANSLAFIESSSNLVATGRVISEIVMTGPASDSKAPPRPQTYRVQADTLTYDDSRRTAVYEAPLVILTTEDGSRTEGRKLTFEMAKESRTLDRMIVEGSMFATMSGGYEVKGDRLAYRADTDVYTVTGKPAVVKSPGEEGNCKRTDGATLELNRKTGRVDLPGRGGAPSSSVAMSCSDSIRK